MFSLFRFQGEEDAGIAAFYRYVEVFTPLQKACAQLHLPCSKLNMEKITSYCRTQPGWSVAHIASAMGWREIFHSGCVQE